jgi:hypothetical protein
LRFLLGYAALCLRGEWKEGTDEKSQYQTNGAGTHVGVPPVLILARLKASNFRSMQLWK